MSKRSEKAAQTTENIIAATERLLTDRPLEKISLNAIAKESGITVQTVLRHMDSREGCIYAVAERVSSRIEKQRGGSKSGNITEAIENLIEHYEQEGKLVLNLLTQEHSEESFVSEFTAEGRNFHRQWVERCFGPPVSGNETEVIDALVVATDIYTWKLLRLDLGRPLDTTKKIMTNMVSKILKIP